MRGTLAVGVLIGSAGLAGCGFTSGVQTGGAGVYSVSGNYPATRGGVLIAQSAALQDAREFCRTQGRRFFPVGDAAGHDAASNQATYTVRFRCLTQGDPLLHAPTVNQSPGEVF